MKWIFTVIVFPVIIWGCNNHSPNENKKADTPGETGHQHQTKAENLKLNSGAKWKADATTLSNVALLRTIVLNAKKDNLDNYIQTAAQLQDGLSKMINECKMKGPDHDALHQWLEPLLEEIKEMKNATEAKNAQEKLKEIEERINLFAQYFEQ